MDVKRKILSVTGIRSEYDLMHPVYQEIQKNKNLSLSLVVTGAHLSKNFGHTIDEVKKDGFEIVECIESLIDGDNTISRLQSAAIQLLHLTQTINRIRPDFLFICGDREEAINTAICGTYLNIPIAHFSGGDRSIGNVDDQVRHSVTKLAHIHFTTSEDSQKRVLNLGEQPFRVFNVGNPGIDRIVSTKFLSKKEVLNHFNFPDESINEPLLILIQHVMSTEIDHASHQMHETLKAIAELKLNTIMSYPNSDAGGREMIKVIEGFRGLSNLRIEKFIPRDIFINSLRHAACLLGNSSLGLLEAPFLKLPVVNIGNRQRGRLNAGNIEFVNHHKDQIIASVNKACFDQKYKKHIQSLACPFGDGTSSKKIADILATFPYNKELLIKDITY